MEEYTKVEVLEDDKNEQEKPSDNSRRNKYILLAIALFIAVFVYDVSPVDLIPFIPIDDIAVTGGGAMGLIALLIKYFFGKNKPK